MTMMISDSLLVWQLADSAFPTGGFAHSGGLEAAWQAGRWRHLEALARVRARRALAGRPWTPAARIRGMHRSASARGARPRLPRVPDQRRRESREPRAGPRACRDVRADLAWRVDDAPSRIAWRALNGHHAPVFGAALSLLGVPLETMQQLFLYTSLRGLAVGRRPPGHRRCIRRAATAGRLCGTSSTLVRERCAALRDTDIAQTAPILDLLQAGHDRLYSRLFQS